MAEEAKAGHNCADSFFIKATVLEDGSHDCFDSCSHHMFRDAANVTSIRDHTAVQSVAEPTNRKLFVCDKVLLKS